MNIIADEKKQKETAPVKKSNTPQLSLLSSDSDDDESSEEDEEPSAYAPSFGSSGPSLQRTKTQSSLPTGVIGGTLSRRGGVLRQQSLQAMMGGSTSTISFMDDEIESESD